MFIRLLLLTLLASLTLAAPGFAAPSAELPTTILFGMPISGKAVKEGNTGVITEMLKKIFAPEGFTLIHRELPYRRAINELVKGKIHCSLDIKDNLKDVYRSNSVVATLDLAATYLRPRVFKGVEDLAGQKVAHNQGYDIQMLLPVAIRSQPTYDLASAIHMLDRGHVTFVVGDHMLLDAAIAESGLPPSLFDTTPLMSLDLIMVFPHTEQGRLLRDIFDRRMQVLLDSGELERVMRENGLGEDGIQRVLKANRR